MIAVFPWNISKIISQELSITGRQVDSVISLLDEGATVPFIARYRKEVTGGLDDSQLRTLEERLRYLTELQERKDTVLKSIKEQGKLTEEQAIARIVNLRECVLKPEEINDETVNEQLRLRLMITVPKLKYRILCKN